MGMSELVKKLKGVNDEIQASNELAEKQKLTFVIELNQMLIGLLLGLIDKNT